MLVSIPLVERFEQTITSNLVFSYIGEQIPKSYEALSQWIECNEIKFNYCITLSILYSRVLEAYHFGSRESFENAVQCLADMHRIIVFEHACTMKAPPLW